MEEKQTYLCSNQIKVYTLTYCMHVPGCLWSANIPSLHYWTGTTALDILLAWQPVRIEMTSHMTPPRLSRDKAREHHHFFHRGRLHNRQRCTKEGKKKGPITRCSVPIIPGTSRSYKDASSAAQQSWSGCIFPPSTSWSHKCYWAAHKWCITAPWGKVSWQRTKEKWVEKR